MFPHKNVFFPAARTVPQSVLRVLRAIDDSVCVVWLRRGAWLLSTVTPNEHRMHAAGTTRAKLHYSSLPFLATTRDQFEMACQRWGNREAMTRLRMQGVVEQKTFECSQYADHVVWAEMELWLRAARWVRQHHYEAYWRAMDEAQEKNDDEEAKLSSLLDKARLREAYRMGFKNPVSQGWTPARETASGSVSLITAA
jgi:hypothetical protein